MGWKIWVVLGIFTALALAISSFLWLGSLRYNQPESELAAYNQSEVIKGAGGSGEGNLTADISNITNITCDYCQYPLNGSCINYTCCADSQCLGNESCIDNSCIPLNCSSCQYVENHNCVDFECCKDEDCEINQTCHEHECMDYECYQHGDCSDNQVCISYECLNKSCPTESCEDYDHCTVDYCNPITVHCQYKYIVPCCGNGVCEIQDGEDETNCQTDCNDTSKFFYCEDDYDCVPSCSVDFLGNVDSFGRPPYGICINRNYTRWDVQSIYNPRLCDDSYEASPRQCIQCYKCVNNQCITNIAECTPECLNYGWKCGE